MDDESLLPRQGESLVPTEDIVYVLCLENSPAEEGRILQALVNLSEDRPGQDIGSLSQSTSPVMHKRSSFASITIQPIDDNMRPDYPAGLWVCAGFTKLGKLCGATEVPFEIPSHPCWMTKGSQVSLSMARRRSTRAVEIVGPYGT